MDDIKIEEIPAVDEPKKCPLQHTWIIAIIFIFIASIIGLGFVLILILAFYKKKKKAKKDNANNVLENDDADEKALEKLIEKNDHDLKMAKQQQVQVQQPQQEMHSSQPVSNTSVDFIAIVTHEESAPIAKKEVSEKIQLISETEYESSHD
jgi:cbb3-type cytochrome oxidase subunit 3